MRYLLDTHVIMWALIGDKRIPENLKKELLDNNNQLYYSTVSSWEVEIKHQKVETFTLSAEQFCFLCDQNDIQNLPVKNKHIFRLKEEIKKNDLIKHNDPFDKMLLAQAIDENMIFVTHDQKFKLYNQNNILFI